MRFTAIYVKKGHPAQCKEIEAASNKEAVRKAQRACPKDRDLGHITGNHSGDVIWDSEKRKRR